MPTGLHVYRFTKIGVTTDEVVSMVPPASTVSTIIASPVAHVDVTVNNASVDPETDLSAGMLDLGYTLLEVDPDTGQEWANLQRFETKLPLDAPAILPPAGWVNVISVTLLTHGESFLDVSAMPVFGCLLEAGLYRLTVTGGAFLADTVVVDDLPIDVLSGRKAYSLLASVDLPPTVLDTSYEVRLQARAGLLAGSVTPRKDSILRVVERKLQNQVAP